MKFILSKKKVETELDKVDEDILLGKKGESEFDKVDEVHFAQVKSRK